MPPVRLFLRPPTIEFFLLIIALALNFTIPIRKIIPFPTNLTGIPIIILGLLIAIWGNATFQRNNVELIPGSKSIRLVKSGPFTFSRNPMYLGMVLLALGVALLLGNLSAFILPIVHFIYLNSYMIPFEETLMERTFRTSYEDYKRKVRRWI